MFIGVFTIIIRINQTQIINQEADYTNSSEKLEETEILSTTLLPRIEQRT